VDIKAEFPWGSETVETICYSGVRLFENIESTERELFEVYCSFICATLIMYKNKIGKVYSLEYTHILSYQALSIPFYLPSDTDYVHA
jgi:hypothetical protein